MISEINKIHDLVYVFSYKDELEKVYSLLLDGYRDKENSPHFGGWVPWADFGEYVNNPHDGKKEGVRARKELASIESVHNIFKETTEYYLNEFNLSPDPEWRRMGPSFCRYFDSVGGHWDHFNDEDREIKESSPELAMVYHTDYVYQDRFEDSWKFILTCTMYLNDDYEGGDLKFRINDENFEYKPKAGDVVVFPSGHPELLSDKGIFFHAVGAIRNNPKYFIRCFYQKWTEGIKE